MSRHVAATNKSMRLTRVFRLQPCKCMSCCRQCSSFAVPATLTAASMASWDICRYVVHCDHPAQVLQHRQAHLATRNGHKPGAAGQHRVVAHERLGGFGACLPAAALTTCCSCTRIELNERAQATPGRQHILPPHLRRLKHISRDAAHHLDVWTQHLAQLGKEKVNIACSGRRCGRDCRWRV